MATKPKAPLDKIKMVITTLKAPQGKFRIVGVDLFEHTGYLVGDYPNSDEAFAVADGHNKKRTGAMADVYYVYDDKGNYLRGNEAVKQEVSP